MVKIIKRSKGDAIFLMKYQQLMRFMLVGVVNTLFGASLMFILYNICHVNYWWSSAANYFFGSIVSFYLNKRFTFQVRYYRRQIIYFTLNIVVCYFISYGIAKPIVELFLVSISVKSQDNLSMLLGMILFTMLNYVGQRYVVFKRENY